MSIRKGQKRHIPKVKHNETKNVALTNIDKISVILKDTNIFSFCISFIKRLNLSEILREYKRNKWLGKYKPIFE